MLTSTGTIWVHTPEGSTASFWQELSCEIRRAGYAVEHTWPGAWIHPLCNWDSQPELFLGSQYVHRASAHLSSKRSYALPLQHGDWSTPS